MAAKLPRPANAPDLRPVGQVFTLQTIPPQPDLPPGSERVAKLAGFSLHAGVAAKAHQRDKLERLRRHHPSHPTATMRIGTAPITALRAILGAPQKKGYIPRYTPFPCSK